VVLSLAELEVAEAEVAAEAEVVVVVVVVVPQSAPWLRLRQPAQG